MCNDCVYVNSPDQVIKGCCIVKEGYYCIWDLNHMTLVCEEWTELCDLYNVLRQVSHITFNVVSERQRARNALNNLKREAPFGECRRFPWRKTFVNVSCSIYGTLFQNVLGALDYKDRETEKELRYGKDREQKDPDQTASSGSSLDDAKTSFRNNLKSLLNELCKKNEIYDRIKFETKYGLQWCEGPCPTEPGVENPPGGTPPPNTPDNPTGKTYGDIMRHLRSRGLDAEDFNVFTEADILAGRFVCGKELQRLGPTLEKNLLPKDVSNVYVFTTGEYSKCGDPINPTRGYIYRPGSDSLMGETELRVSPTTFDNVEEMIDLINRVLDKREEDLEIKSNNSRKSNSSGNEGEHNSYQRNYQQQRFYNPNRRYNNNHYYRNNYSNNNSSSRSYKKKEEVAEGSSHSRVQDLAEQSSGEMV
jgi:hypothetical protein